MLSQMLQRVVTRLHHPEQLTRSAQLLSRMAPFKSPYYTLQKQSSDVSPLQFSLHRARWYEDIGDPIPILLLPDSSEASGIAWRPFLQQVAQLPLLVSTGRTEPRDWIGVDHTALAFAHKLTSEICTRIAVDVSEELLKLPVLAMQGSEEGKGESSATSTTSSPQVHLMGRGVDGSRVTLLVALANPQWIGSVTCLINSSQISNLLKTETNDEENTQLNKWGLMDSTLKRKLLQTVTTLKTVSRRDDLLAELRKKVPEISEEHRKAFVKTHIRIRRNSSFGNESMLNQTSKQTERNDRSHKEETVRLNSQHKDASSDCGFPLKDVTELKLSFEGPVRIVMTDSSVSNKASEHVQEKLRKYFPAIQLCRLDTSRPYQQLAQRIPEWIKN